MTSILSYACSDRSTVAVVPDGFVAVEGYLKLQGSAKVKRGTLRRRLQHPDISSIKWTACHLTRLFGSDSFGLIQMCFVIDSRDYTLKLMSLPCFSNTGHTTCKGQEHDKLTREFGSHKRLSNDNSWRFLLKVSFLVERKIFKLLAPSVTLDQC